MNYQHTVRYLRLSPKKLSLTAKGIKGMKVTRAQEYLVVQKQQGAQALLAGLKSALNNAEQEGIKLNEAKVVAVAIQKGPTFMRRWLRAKGRATPKRKPTVHFTIMLTDEKKAAKKEKPAKKTERKTKSEAK